MGGAASTVEIGGSFEQPGSGIFKSTDGGDHWTRLQGGLPAAMGRAEIAIAPSNTQIVYAYVDGYGSTGGTVFRSDDGGQNFTAVNDDQSAVGERGDDLVAIAVDPKDPQTVYVTTTSTYRSTDGGKHFIAIKGAPGGDDYQNIWINPNDPNIIGLVSDQGATISVDRGATWSSWYNQPTAQMYHVNTDNRFPYRVCGGQQESGSACVLSRGDWGEITERDWETVGAEEYGYVVPDPLHPGVFFGGKVEKFDERTGQQLGSCAEALAPERISRRAYRADRLRQLRPVADVLRRKSSLHDARRRHVVAHDQPGSHSRAVRDPGRDQRIRIERSTKRARIAALSTRSPLRTGTRARFGPVPTMA